MRAYLLKYDVEEKTYEIVNCREYGLNTSIKVLVEYFKNLVCAKIVDEQHENGCRDKNNKYKCNWDIIRDTVSVEDILAKISESKTFRCKSKKGAVVATISCMSEYLNKLYEYVVIFCDTFYFTGLETLEKAISEISDVTVERNFNQLYVRILDKTDNKPDTLIIIDGKSNEAANEFGIAVFVPEKPIELHLETATKLNNIKLPDVSAVIEFIESAKAVDFKNRFNWLSVITNS